MNAIIMERGFNGFSNADLTDFSAFFYSKFNKNKSLAIPSLITILLLAAAHALEQPQVVMAAILM